MVGACLAGALVFQRPALVVLACPLLLVTLADLWAGPPPELVVCQTNQQRQRLVEGEDLTIELELRAADGRAVQRVDVVLAESANFAARLVKRSATLSLAAGATETVRLTVTANAWGRRPIGPVSWLVAPRLGTAGSEGVLLLEDDVIVLPRPAKDGGVSVEPRRSGLGPGRHRSPARADGIELADLRDYVAGDSMRSVNWRASARRGDLVVNERHPERHAEVVVFVDTFSAQALLEVVRVALAVAEGSFAGRDRVGVVAFGGAMQWLRPGEGLRHIEQVRLELLGLQSFRSESDKPVALIPRRVLPPRALLIVVSPLYDDRIVAALGQLRSRGSDVSLITVEDRDEAGQSLAERLWRQQRRAQIEQIRAQGVAVASAGHGRPIEAVLEELRRWRRANVSRTRR